MDWFRCGQRMGVGAWETMLLTRAVYRTWTVTSYCEHQLYSAVLQYYPLAPLYLGRYSGAPYPSRTGT